MSRNSGIASSSALAGNENERFPLEKTMPAEDFRGGIGRKPRDTTGQARPNNLRFLRNFD
jgi:hypothetical protein